MAVSDLPKLVRNAGRFHEVVAVVLKYGLAPWLCNVKADWVQRQLRSNDGQQIAELPEAVRVRMALTELGTTFIKLGQILSTRADLVGPELAHELAELQSSTPPDSPEQVLELIESELGKLPEDLFRSFESHALASASIGQVHRAVLNDGTRVVVKVQHQDIEYRVQNDLEILIELAKLAETYSTDAAQFSPVATAQEFRETLLHELDFTREQQNLKRFAANFSSDEGVYFPAPHPDLCTKRVLTMDALEGISVSSRDQLDASGFDLTDIARRGADMFLKMVFRDGFYHADPHPGNLMVLQNAVIGVLDCGMVGRVDEDLREMIEDLLIAAINKDTDQLLDSVVQLGELPTDFDRSRLRSDLVEFIDDYGSLSIDQFDLSGALTGMTEIVRSHHILLPSRVSLLIKMLVMLEGTAQQLNPTFNIVELLEPYRLDAIKRRLSPQRMWRNLQRSHRDWSRLAESFPNDVSDVLNRIRRGSFDVHLEHRRLDSIVNRLVLGLLTSALFVGSTSLLSNKVKPLIYETSVAGIIGCAAAMYLGVRLVLAIKKSGNI
ncbi:ABC1 kinase family protein [Rhodopirellula sallentina]|uniref:Ubiquinone biosynthesis protein AarF n=1 Tax=Rhodopirellula sallentina SM41 TaxID=1263870 RepID=M5TXN6_9BACT|nr:AarF/ABC1/UbiB kinase family protein [Rhodopirellula sallentina]EMI53950.1 ubiquinone biosynthesis protein AarF [Rhodopirellula sallentina SM41]